MFGHIAHYNSEGFYSTWFSTNAQQLGWIEYILKFTPYDDPAWTWCDVEKEFIDWLKKNETAFKGNLSLGAYQEKTETMLDMVMGMSMEDRKLLHTILENNM